jgi:hypothetical protein
MALLGHDTGWQWRWNGLALLREWSLMWPDRTIHEAGEVAFVNSPD